MTRHRQMKSWRGSGLDANGKEIHSLTTQADTQTQALEQLLNQAAEMPGIVNVKLGEIVCPVKK